MADTDQEPKIAATPLRLQLRRGAEAFVSGRLFIFRGRGGSKEVTFADGSTAQRCHDALRIGVSAAELEQALGLRGDEVEELAALLEREGMLARATKPSATGVHAFAPVNVVFVGLGDLGLAIIERAVASAAIVGAVVDSELVTIDDVGERYRSADVGSPRVDVALPRLQPAVALQRSDETAVADAIARADVVVCVLEHPDAFAEWLADRCRELRRPLVLVETEAHGTALCTFRWGPQDPIAGCVECRRRHLARRDPLRRHLADHPPDGPLAWRHRPSPAVRDLVVALAVASIARPRLTSAGGPTQECFVAEATGEPVREPVIRAPLCSRCDPRAPPESAELFSAAARRWQTKMRTQRTALPLPELGERLRGLRGPRTGLIGRLEQRTRAHQDAAAAFLRERGVVTDELPECFARLRSAMALLPGRERVLSGEGFDFTGDAASAEALASIEGLERMFALDSIPAGRTFVAPYRSIAERAVDPIELQLYSDEQYATPGFLYRRFDPDEPLRWVVGVRVSDAEPIAVPFDAVAGGPLCQATSSGAAAHSSLPLAVLAATIEAVERDAFLVTWHNRLQRARLDRGASHDGFGLQEVLERAGFAISYVDVTTDIGVPIVMQVVRDRHNPDFFIANTASGGSPEHALGKLMRELVQVSLGYMFDRTHMCGPVTAAEDPRAVENLAQHLQFYQRRDKNRHADFLDGSAIVRPIAELAWPSVSFAEPAAERVVLETVRAAGFDPIVVDCTPESLEAVGLAVIRAVVPGLAPLDSGWMRRRLGGRRIFEAPRRMGLRASDTRIEDGNPWPHPGA